MNFFSKLLGITAKQQPVHLDDTNFAAEVLKSAQPVVIDVWGQKCSHCKRLEPIMMELAAQYAGRVKVCEIAAETAPRTMGLLQIQSTPTVLYFQGGKELERVAGFRGSLFHQESIEALFGIAD
jgi:thioredoxin-like negative regulator of GroEL